MLPKQKQYEAAGRRVIDKMKEKQFEAYFVHSKEEAKDLALSLIDKTGKVFTGGSVTLNEIGLIDALKQENYLFTDRNDVDQDGKVQLSYDAFTSDYYLMSTNAFTLDGELVNVDGNGNRVAALMFGPKHVIIIAGMNKMVKNVDEAFSRVELVAAPMNTARLGTQTPCVKTGICHQCSAKDKICCQKVITQYSRIPNRIKVILVGEDLGF